MSGLSAQHNPRNSSYSWNKKQETAPFHEHRKIEISGYPWNKFNLAFIAE